jgi:RNA polymerase sigma-70 factor, ECF subfamily
MSSDVAVRWDDTASLDDEGVLIRAAQQDPAGFAPLYERYRHRVYAYLRARTAGEEDAADLTQQVFLQALAAIPRYRIRATPFGVWLFRIARNVATDATRRRRGTVTWDSLPEALHPQGPDVEAEVEQREAVMYLQACLRELDAGSRDLLLLRFAARLTTEEIAAVTGTTTAATSKRLQRALHSLKERYHDHSR